MQDSGEEEDALLLGAKSAPFHKLTPPGESRNREAVGEGLAEARQQNSPENGARDQTWQLLQLGVTFASKC